jgi:hypothetical protein
LLLKAGVPLKVVSERLGHSSPASTMTVYQHVLPGMQRDAADVFARLITERTAIPDDHATMVSVDVGSGGRTTKKPRPARR